MNDTSVDISGIASELINNLGNGNIQEYLDELVNKYMIYSVVSIIFLIAFIVVEVNILGRLLKETGICRDKKFKELIKDIGIDKVIGKLVSEHLILTILMVFIIIVIGSEILMIINHLINIFRCITLGEIALLDILR